MIQKYKKFAWIFLATSGFSAVLMGAAAAHWLVRTLEPNDIIIIKKAATYQMYHSLALLALLLAYECKNELKVKLPVLFFIVGIILFSGSLYAYSFTHFKPLVYITPLGGFSFMFGWVSLSFVRGKNS